MRYGVLTVLVLVVGVAAQERPRSAYIASTYGPRAALQSGASAAIGQARNAPREWGGGVAGFAKRFGSAFSQHIIGATVSFGVAAARHEDLSYRRSTETRFGPRLKHALVSTVITRKTTTGERTPAVGRVSGALTSGFISRLWQPARLHTFASGAATSGIMLGADAGVNVAREFWPQRHHPVAQAKSQ